MTIGQWSIVHNDEGWLFYFVNLLTHIRTHASVDITCRYRFTHCLHACTDASNASISKNCISKQVSLYALIGLHADVWTVNVSKECKRTHWHMKRQHPCVWQNWCTYWCMQHVTLTSVCTSDSCTNWRMQGWHQQNMHMHAGQRPCVRWIWCTYWCMYETGI
jgi:hypothetical protein